MWHHSNGYGVHDSMGWGAWVMMLVLLLLFVGLCVGLALALRPRARSGSERDDTPQRVLAERYARGEIDDEEYQRRLKVLGST